MDADRTPNANSGHYPERRREAIERLKVFADGHTLDVSVKQLINEGRT